MATFGTTIGSGGFRLYDSGHEVSYNYVQGVYGGNFQAALLLDSGDAEGSSTNLAGHWRVVNALVEKNVLVGNPTGIVIGHNYSSAPTGCTIRDNVVAQAGTGAAVTQKIAPVNTTQTNNTYSSTPSGAGLSQDATAIWRKAGVGPRLTYLQAGDVGVSGDPNDSDGTGTLIDGGTPPPDPEPGDLSTAAGRHGWGSPLASSDEFNYNGSPDSTKWSLYNGPGHDGNGRRLPERVTVDGSKLVGTGLSNGDSFGMAHKLNQQYGRWEARMRTYQTGGAPPPVGQTLGVGGVATPPGAILATGNTSSRLTISTSGTAENPRVYDGRGFTVGRITVSAGTSHVVIQNYRVNADGQYGIYVNPPGSGSKSHHITIQNNDIKNIHGPGDLNAITFFGDDIKILYNTCVDFIVGDPGGSHSDCIQSWNNDPNESSSRVWIIGNKFVGLDPDRPVHQCIMAQGKAATDGGGGGTGDSTDWYISDNEFGAAWNQDVKLEDIDNSVVTRNRFVGSSTRAIEIRSSSTNTRFYSDNIVGPNYGSVGATITSGAGPASPLGGGTSPTPGANYHVVLIVWPQSDRWPEDGEYDFVELSEPGQQSLVAFMHFPHDPDVPVQQRQFTKAGVDTAQWHNYAFEWTPTHLKGFVDGEEWFATSGGANADRRDIQTMPSGHLTVQLDNFDGTNQIPATVEVDWARVYTLTPSGPGAGPQTVTAVGISSTEGFGFPLVQIVGAPPPPPNGTVPTLLGINTVLGQVTLGYTPGEGEPPPPGSQTVSGAGRIPSAAAFGVPALSQEDGPQTLATVGITSAEAFGRPRVFGSGSPPPPAPGGVLVPSLFAVAADGETLTPLPFWTKISLSPVRNSPGALAIEYPAGAPGFSALHDGVSATPLKALEIRVWLGGNATGALGGWLLQKAGDDLEPGSRWVFSGHFHEWILAKALVYPQAISEANKKGELRFAGANAGLILSTVLSQAQARGALPLISRDFSTTVDSNGQPWAKSVSSLNFAPKTTVQQVADKLVELGLCEYEISAARVWRAYNPGTRGVDRTTSSTPLTFAHAISLSEHARRESSKDAGTAVLAAGAEGFYADVSSPTAQAELGWRAEVATDAGQVASADGVQAVAATYLEVARAGVAEYAAGVEFSPGSPLPLIDYGVGDWAYTWAGDKRRKLRIAQLVLEFSNDAPPAGKVALNDLITDKLTALYQRLNAISAGDAVVGTSTPTPGGSGEDNIPPAAPQGVTVSSTIAYQIPGEAVTRALVDVGWQAVTTNAYADATVSDKVRAAGLIAERIRSGPAVEQGNNDKAAAAGLIRDRLNSGQSMFEDWTWSGAPAVVGQYNDVLIAEFRAARPQAHAADLIGGRMDSGQPMFEDWTWSGAPSVVGRYNDTLLAEFEAAGSGSARSWLRSYVHSATLSWLEQASGSGSGGTIFEDWTWSGMPGVVGQYNDVLLEEWQAHPSNPGGDSNTLGGAALAWLEAYAVTHIGGGAITDDVAHYRVQYRYLGAAPVGSGSGTLPPDWIPTTPRDPNEVTETSGWFEPTESPTANTRLTFGEVIGGRSIGVRVNAVDRVGNQGPWSVIVAATTAVDDQPPPKPSKPIAVPWFETANVTWDGKGAAGEDLFAAANDLASGGRVEVHMGEGIDFVPHRPLAADGKTADLSQSNTYKTDFQWAGTTNIVDIPRGVTVFFRFVAVDRNGNASDPSDTSDGVLAQQLVNIQIGPGAIARQQIIDGEIVNAKIADLAVNNAKISDLSVGKLTAGTMNAVVVIGGRFETPLTNGHQIQIDNGGFRMYRQGTVIGRWQTFDGSMMMTGQFQSNITGQRVVINPGGSNPDTIRLYPSASETYSSIDSVDFNGGSIAGVRIVGSGTSATSNRGMLLIRDQYASLVHGRTDLSYWGSEIWVEQSFTRNKSATVDLIVDERLAPVAGTRRVAMIHYNTAGQPINATGLYYTKTIYNGGEPQFYGNGMDIALVFAPGHLYVRNNPNNDFRDLTAKGLFQASGRSYKRDIRDLTDPVSEASRRRGVDRSARAGRPGRRPAAVVDDLTDPVTTLRRASPKRFRWHDDPDDRPDRVGFIAEELPEPIRVSAVQQATNPDDPPLVVESLDYSALTTVLVAAMQRIEERVSELETRTRPGPPA